MVTFVADAYAWMAFFKGDLQYADLMKTSSLKTPAVAVGEIAHVLSRLGKSEKDIAKFIAVIERRSSILILEKENAIVGGLIAAREKLDFADALNYSYASPEELFLTGDEDFRKKPRVYFLKEKIDRKLEGFGMFKGSGLSKALHAMRWDERKRGAR